MPRLKIAIIALALLIVLVFLFRKFLAYQREKNEYLTLKFRYDTLKTRLFVLLRSYDKNPIYKDDTINLEIINEHKKLQSKK